MVKDQNVFEVEETKIRSVFVLCELAPFLELVHHFVGFQKMKRHTFINLIIHNWMLFGVIDCYPGVLLTSLSNIERSCDLMGDDSLLQQDSASFL